MSKAFREPGHFIKIVVRAVVGGWWLSRCYNLQKLSVSSSAQSVSLHR